MKQIKTKSKSKIEIKGRTFGVGAGMKTLHFYVTRQVLATLAIAPSPIKMPKALLTAVQFSKFSSPVRLAAKPVWRLPAATLFRIVTRELVVAEEPI